MCGCGQSCCDGIGKLRFSILGRGLHGLSNVKAGSELAVGFRYSGSILDNVKGILPPSPETIEQTITGCLYGTGAFSQLKVEVKTGFATNYVTVKGTISIDFNQAEDIGALVEGRIRECFPDFAYFISSRDPVAVYAIPQDPNLPQANIQIPAGTPGGPPASAAQGAGQESLLQKLGLGGGTNTKSGSSTTTLILLLVGAVVVSKALSK